MLAGEMGMVGVAETAGMGGMLLVVGVVWVRGTDVRRCGGGSMPSACGGVNGVLPVGIATEISMKKEKTIH